MSTGPGVAPDVVPDAVPDVSVVIPVYNTVDYLGACLDSLLAQTLREQGEGRLEVVAVDDGSTDGSGELLDAYAARHPGVVRVLHQANSGGPARPCNAGLDVARGRFVFFLGSDDHLAHDALERLVERADAWEADVVVPPMEGVNGRFVDQRLFAAEHPDIEFPGDLMPYSLSNTKLFRRSLVEEQQLRYSLDLRVGSDQPFAVAAMLAARRIGVIAKPTAYFAVKRRDQGNITYRLDWRTRLDDLSAVAAHLADLVPRGERRDALLVRHFMWEFDKLLTRDLPHCDDDQARDLLTALAGVAERYLTDGLLARLTGPARLHWRLLHAGHHELLRAVVGPAGGRSRLHLGRDGVRLQVRDDDGAWAEVRLPDDLPPELGEDLAAMTGAGLGPWLSGLDEHARVDVVDGVLRLRAVADDVDPASTARIELALSPLHDLGMPRAALDVAADRGTRVIHAAPLVIAADATASADLDLAAFAEAGGGRLGLRLRVTTSDRILDRPIRLGADLRGAVATPRSRGEVCVTCSTEDRALVEVTAAPTLRGRVGGRLRGLRV